jgi:hypothetical protein
MRLKLFGRNRGSIGLLLLSLAGNGFCAGFVSLTKDSGIWWFKSPDGKPFLSIGANHVEPFYWQSPNNKAFVLDTYGPDLFTPDGDFRDGSPAAEKLAQRVAAIFKTCGFNTFGFHNPLSQSLHSASHAYYVVTLDIPIPWGWSMPRSLLLKAFKNRPFDIFDDAVKAMIEANAAEQVKPYANDPMVLGYAYTDGPPWTVDDDKEASILQKLTAAEKTLHPWVFALMSLPPEAKGKQAWLTLMKERYPSPEAAGATYACTVSTWDELAFRTVWTSISDTAKATDDSQAFLEKLMRQWYTLRKNAIRIYDQNHLILGDKLNMNRDSKHPEQLIRSLHIMKDYVDVINLQYYGTFDKQRDTLALLYRETGKPILNGDTTFSTMWEDNPPDSEKYYTQLGQLYADQLTQMFSLPYYIGWHHCGYMRGLRKPYVQALQRGDQASADSFVKKKQTYREGFITEFEEPIAPLIKPIGLAISNCEPLHRNSGAPVEK